MNVELIEGAIYKLKVGLYAEKWNETGSFGNCGMIQPGSDVFYDQESNGWHIFGCFAPENQFYCRIPDYIVHEQVELVDKENLVPRKDNIDKI